MEIQEPCILRQLRTPEGRELRKQGIDTFANKELSPRPDGVTNTLTSVEKDNYVCEPERHKFRIRKLTPRECFRLMGCDEPTIDKLLNARISNSQLYKLAGNSIVVDVLTAIFYKMFVNTKHSIGDQLTLF